MLAVQLEMDSRLIPCSVGRRNNILKKNETMCCSSGEGKPNDSLTELAFGRVGTPGADSSSSTDEDGMVLGIVCLLLDGLVEWRFLRWVGTFGAIFRVQLAGGGSLPPDCQWVLKCGWV